MHDAIGSTKKQYDPGRAVLTVGVGRGCPPTNLLQPGVVPQLGCSLGGVFQTLFDLDSLVRFEDDVIEMDVTLWRIERLMTTTVNVVNILPDYIPVLDVENLLSENFICLQQSVQDESVKSVSKRESLLKDDLEGDLVVGIPVGYSFAIFVENNVS